MRLFNEYDACTDREFMQVVDDAIDEIIAYAKGHGLDLHDALGVTAMSMTAQFAEEFLRNGLGKRKKERFEAEKKGPKTT